jgi:hypothetical protein
MIRICFAPPIRVETIVLHPKETGQKFGIPAFYGLVECIIKTFQASLKDDPLGCCHG